MKRTHKTLVMAGMILTALLLVNTALVMSKPSKSISATWVNPLDGDTVSDTASIQIDADADRGQIKTVEWKVDDGPYQEATYDSSTGLWTDSWDTTQYSDGDHSLTARAQNSPGDTDTSTIGVTVDNNDAPSVSWNNPLDGDTVSDTASIEIAASDSDGYVDSVTWQVDDGAEQTATYNNDTGQYEASWDTTTVEDGSHTLTATATDDDGASTTQTITVTVDNKQEPSVSWFKPEDGANVTGTEDIKIAASDEDGTVSSVEWHVEGELYNQSATYNSDSGYWEDTWDTTQHNNTWHDLTAVATDDDGNTNSDTISVFVNN